MPGTSRSLQTRSTVKSRRGDAGFSLVELMVAIVIFSIVGGIVTAALVSSNKAARTTSNSVQTQAQLVDAMTHIGRDISAGSIVPTAAVDSLEVRGVQSGNCIVSVFTATGTSLDEARTTLADTTCPATGGTTNGTSNKTLITNLTATQIFTYFDSGNNNITADITDPDNPTSTSDIKRVSYTVSAAVDGRSPMVLTSSITLIGLL